MSESVEFQVITDLAPIAGTRLETNAEQVKAWLTEQVAPYRAMVVSEEGMAAARLWRTKWTAIDFYTSCVVSRA